MLNCEMVVAKPNVIEIARQDEMFECGKGIIVLWEKGKGCTMIPATGTKNFGLDYLLEKAKEYAPEWPEYKVKQMYFKLMSASNYARGRVVL